MKNIRLYIGGKRADLDGSLNIPFTYQTSDSQMPTAVKNSFSKTVTLQGTEQNRRIFDGLWRLDSRVKDAKARQPEYRVDYTETDAEFTNRAVPSAAQGDLVKVTAVKGNTIVSGNELVNNAATEVETLTAGGTSLGTLSTPTTELASGGVQIFPDGMKSAGSVSDEWSGTTATKRIGVVDLGTLRWVRRLYSNAYFFIVELSSLARRTHATLTSYVRSMILVKQATSIIMCPTKQL